ncbi:histidine phosphatase family protein [Nocardioides sp. BGMRC 2183]|nr:histidine phosphatase family protein [Nocardioides sp. BGMRC 2183]
MTLSPRILCVNLTIAALLAGLVSLAFTHDPASARDGSHPGRQPGTHPSSTAATVVYFVEHGEPDFTADVPRNDLPLSERGHRYADAVTTVLADVGFTHVYSSQTVRAAQTVGTLAERRGLDVERLPTGRPEASTADAAAPIVAAIRRLRPGSTALVGGNTENLFTMMTMLGVPVRSDCGRDEQCLPCPDRTCFAADDLNTIWQLTIVPRSRGARPIQPVLQRLRTETPNVMVAPAG